MIKEFIWNPTSTYVKPEEYKVIHKYIMDIARQIEEQTREHIAKEIEALDIKDNSFDDLDAMITIRSALEQRAELIEWVKSHAAAIARGKGETD